MYLSQTADGPRPGGWGAEDFSALINGAAYGVPEAKGANNTVLNMNSQDEFDTADTSGTMTIKVERVLSDPGDKTPVYNLTITCGSKTYKYSGLLGTGTSGPGADASGTIMLQSHWGSGVKFTKFRILPGAM